MKKEEFRNLPIGEIFDYEGAKLKVRERGLGCIGCHLFEAEMCDLTQVEEGLVPECRSDKRIDKKDVIFSVVKEEKTIKKKKKKKDKLIFILALFSMFITVLLGLYGEDGFLVFIGCLGAIMILIGYFED